MAERAAKREEVLGVRLTKAQSTRLLKELTTLSPDRTGTSLGADAYHEATAESYRRILGKEAADSVNRFTSMKPGRRYEGRTRGGTFLTTDANGNAVYRNDEERGGEASPKGKGRSEFVEQHSSSVIEAAFAFLDKMVTETTNPFRVLPSQVGKEEQAREAAMVLKHIILDDADARRSVGAFLKAGLIESFATAQVVLYQPEPRVEYYQNMTNLAFEMIEADENLDVEAYSETPADETERARYPNGFKYDLRVRVRSSMEPRIEPVPIWEMILPTDASTISQQGSGGPGYVARARTMQLQQVIQMHPEHKERILAVAREKKIIGPDAQPGLGHDSEYGGRSSAAFYELYEEAGYSVQSRDLRRAITVFEEYIWHDLDDDGGDRLLKVVRLEDKHILHVCEVSDNQFACWSTYSVPHRVVGMSLEQRVGPYNEMMTAVWRFYIYSLFFSLIPAWVVNTNLVSERDRAKFFRNLRPGSRLEVSGLPSEALQAAPTNNSQEVINQAAQQIRMLGQHSRESIGLDLAQLAAGDEGTGRSAAGLALAQSRGAVNFEQIGGQFALALARLGNTMLRVLVENSDRPIVVRTEGGPRSIDPSSWDRDMRVVVRLAGSEANRSQRIQDLMQVAAIVEKAGQLPYAQLLFGPTEMHNILRETMAAFSGDYPDMFLKVLPPDAEEMAAQMAEAAGKDPKVEAALEKARLDNETKMRQIQADFEAKAADREADREQWQAELSSAEQQAMLEYIADLKRLAAETELGQSKLLIEQIIAFVEAQVKMTVARMKPERPDARDGVRTRPGGREV